MTAIFYQSHQAYDLGTDITALSFWMGHTITGEGNANPGFPVAAKTKELFIEWGFYEENLPGVWELHLRKNGSNTTEATFPMTLPPTPPPVQMVKLWGSWSQEVQFAAGETWHMHAYGPSKKIIIARVVARFEETP